MVALLLLGGAACAQDAPKAAGGPSIYSCVDAHGRTLTADRPIAECIDREQRELNPSGTLKRRIARTDTAQEAADRDERERQAAIQSSLQTEDRRRERALLVRYPDAATHARERGQALQQVDAAILAAKTRLAELNEERIKMDGELQFYKGDVQKAPAAMQRRLDDNARNMAEQERFISDGESVKKRIEARFDEEEVRLRQLWSSGAGD